jgi:hypothetical protein
MRHFQSGQCQFQAGIGQQIGRACPQQMAFTEKGGVKIERNTLKIQIKLICRDRIYMFLLVFFMDSFRVSEMFSVFIMMKGAF